MTDNLEPHPMPCPNPWCHSHDRRDPELFYLHQPVLTDISDNPKALAVACPVCPMTGPPAETQEQAVAAWNDRPATAREVEGLRAALENVMIGGNHLALLIGPDHPPYTADPDVALEHYGYCETYEVWCCWRSIMQARAALEGKGG